MHPHDLQSRVASFYFEYAAVLNEARYAEWPDFFAADACDYRIVSRENHDLGLPAPLMGCYTHGMVQDRVAMLIKGALTYGHMYWRHFISNVRVGEAADNTLRGHANLLIMQSDPEGNSSVYMVGRYEDILLRHESTFRLRQRLVILDSFSIDTAIAVPL